MSQLAETDALLGACILITLTRIFCHKSLHVEKKTKLISSQVYAAAVLVNG